MSDIDVSAAKELFALLHEPVLDAEERVVRNASPQLDETAVLDLALHAAIARLQFTLNRETFEYLRWKVTIARANAQATLEEVTAARADRAIAREQRARSFRDGAGRTWTVTEGSWHAVSGGEQRCLVFSSDSAVRRVKHVPDNWESFTEVELSALSWSR